MAITKQLTGKSLKVLNNYGTVDGKVVRKTRPLPDSSRRH